MKRRMLSLLWVCGGLAGSLLAGETQSIEPGQLADLGVPSGAAREVLPGSGAVVHLQFHDPLSVLEGIERTVVAGVPEKALPPEMQGLFQSEHPLLTLLGVQKLGEPLTAEAVERQIGLDPRGSVTLTLYLGDPRRMFVVGLPCRAREPLAHWLSELLKPEKVEEVSLGEKKALRIVTQHARVASELFLVTSDSMVYVCGDRSLAILLHNSPTAQRFGQDAFMSRVLPAEDERQIRLVINPAPVKPLALQLQAVRGMAGMIIQQQRSQLLMNMPAQAREQMEMQVRTQFGVQNVEEFADYAECMVVATLEQVIDFVTGEMVAFEGLTLTTDLKDQVREFTIKVYSQKFHEETSRGTLPLGEIREALAWLGPDYQCFKASGRAVAPRNSPVLANWVERVRQQLEKKGLEPGFLDRLAKLLEDSAPVPTVESQVPWVLTTYAPLRPLPSLDDAANLGDYFLDLELPIHRPVTLIPGRDTAFLEGCYRAEADQLNRNRQLGFEFANTIQKQKPWVDQLNRFQAEQLDGGVARFTRESAWVTRGGIFGYDQHELVNRKVVWARQVGPYLIYHRGAKGSDWLRQVGPSSSRGVAPAVSQLLEQVPEGANQVTVHRVLVGLPKFVDWLGALETRAHADVQVYLGEAQALVEASSDLEAAKQKIRGLKMPELVGSVALEPETKRVYALLPTGQAAFVLPRPRVVPLLRELLADYAQKADEVGGGLTYTRVHAETWEFTARQRWDALTTLTRSLGNALFERYLATPEAQLGLVERLGNPRDWDAAVFDEVVARNPRYAFIPQPQPKTEATLEKAVPPRDPAAGSGMVDLTDYYNGLLDETWQQGGMANNTLRNLPRGVQELAGVGFDLRGVVQLTGLQAEQQLSVRFPQVVEGIPVRAKGAQVHFLHACGWPAPQGTAIGSYVIHYANGQSHEVPITYGKDVRDWWMNEEPGVGGVEIAWQGGNTASPSGPSVGLYKTTWNNPMPEEEISTIDFRSSRSDAAPFLVAITVE